MKKILFSVMIAAVALTACRKNVEVATEGELSLSFASLADDFEIVTKANDNIDEFNVTIFRPKDRWQMDFVYGEKKGDMIKLGSGDYEITATSPVLEDASWDLPIYKGTQDFKIVAGQVTPLNLTCELDNVKVTFVLSENFKKELSTYNVTVSNGKGELTWVKEGTTDDFAAEKAGYFTAAPLDITVTGHRAIDDTDATTFMTITNVEPKDHHIINLDAKVTGHIGDGEGNGIKIEISTEVTEKKDDVYVDGLEEIPVQGGDDSDDEENPDQPAVSTAPVLLWEANPEFAPTELENISSSGIIGVSWAQSGGESAGLLKERYLAADGIENVRAILDEVEDGKLDSMEFIELNSCTCGCVGGSLTAENPFIAKRRLQMLRKYLPVSCVKYSDEEPETDKLDWQKAPQANNIMRLADNIFDAMKIMGEINDLETKLPKLDCGTCGAPSCKALAEDIVRGFADIHDCMFLTRNEYAESHEPEAQMFRDILPAPFRKHEED